MTKFIERTRHIIAALLPYRVRTLRSRRRAAPGPHPDIDALRASRLVHADWYLRRYPKVADAGMGAIEHFALFGARENRDPNRWFSTQYYRQQAGAQLGAKENPALHYVRDGWRQLFDPSPAFSTADYWGRRMAIEGAEGNPLSHFLSSNPADDPRAGVVLDDTRTPVEESAVHWLEHKTRSAGFYEALARVLKGKRLWSMAEEAMFTVVGIEPGVLRHRVVLADLLSAQGKWWLVVETLEKAITLDPCAANLHYRLGDAQEKMRNFSAAASAYRQAVERESVHATWHYRLGYALERSGDHSGANDAYVTAIQRNPKLEGARFGIGVFHQARGEWQAAAAAYRNQTLVSPADAELHFRLGWALDRTYLWDEAIAAYNMALSVQPEPGSWHYRRGLALERVGRLAEAADAYAVALHLAEAADPKDYWAYRHGYVLTKLGRYRNASEAFLRPANLPANLPATIDIDGLSAITPRPVVDDASAWSRVVSATTEQTLPLLQQCVDALPASAERHHALARVYEQQENWALAAKSLGQALARSSNHQPRWYFQLGHALHQLGQHDAAARALMNTRVLRRPLGVDFAPYEKSPDVAASMAYAEYLETLSLENEVILYESFGGKSASCSPYALYCALSSQPKYAHWLHVWVLDNPERLPTKHQKAPNVAIVSRDSDGYLRYLATAGHLVNNSTFPPYFIRRPAQKYLNTWHGTPLKTLGRDMKGRFLEHRNLTRNLLHTTHLISPNVHTSDVLMEKHEVNDIFPGQLAETGYPRMDLTLEVARTGGEILKRRLGITPGKRVVLYAPTWRGKHGAIVCDSEQTEKEVLALQDVNRHVLFRGHSLIEGLLAEGALGEAVVPGDVDTNELLGVVDVLITDYSSIMFDFFPLGRRVIYYAHDLDTYQRERGLYFSLEELPGTVCRTLDEVKQVLANDAAIPAGDYAKAVARFCSKDDGFASERVVAFFMEDAQDEVVHRYRRERQSLLFYAGVFPPNGITSSCINLVRALDPERYAITMAVDPHGITSFATRMERFENLPETTGRVARLGRMVMTPEERWVADRYNQRFDLESPAMWHVFGRAYEREYRRTFGYARFDGLVQFEGYSRMWSAIFAHAQCGPATRSIYLHNDMYSEWSQKYPYLTGMFRLYGCFDQLITVSKTMRDHNRDRLAARFGIDPNRFTFCENVIDEQEIAHKAIEPVDADIERWINGRWTFFTMGRLSPEKDHAKLIRAMSDVHESHPEACLVILGDGPLRNQLDELVTELGIGASVFLGGLRSNPFPLLRQSDCFVLPSNHEGQPMVLLEAMALGCSIIATDIEGSRDVLLRGYGELTPNTRKGLHEAMIKVISGGRTDADFDAGSYRKEAIGMFLEKVVQGR